ncbi:hypothetical protein [Chloroflexus sp. MS-G]|jgi:hypothetical protein|uniref:hypothetical protein n=1 Tax=Chloroflexus sp. MS-G TaxID=1521187 RepID=UPI0004DF493E|nr:hypothetical protein [Chloroflexus sp. MS-G]MBO9369311.1 hypothetical protein [Chloroflexota bacterium]
MGLDPKDPKPTQITIREAYTKIRQWYRVNVPKFLDRPAKEIETGEFKIVRDFSASAKACFDLVDNLPDQSELSDIEIRAVLVEVISGKLEWAYHQSDGDYKMAAYAHAALEQAGLPTFLSEAEKRELRGSRIYPFLKRQL